MFEILDLGLFFGLISLVLYILTATGVIALGKLANIFLILFIVFLVLWVILRFFCGFRSGGFYQRGYGAGFGSELLFLSILFGIIALTLYILEVAEVIVIGSIYLTF